MKALSEYDLKIGYTITEAEIDMPVGSEIVSIKCFSGFIRLTVIEPVTEETETRKFKSVYPHHGDNEVTNYKYIGRHEQSGYSEHYLFEVLREKENDIKQIKSDS